MANQDDAQRIAMALPGVIASKERFAFSVENKGKAEGFIWAWNERIDPRSSACSTFRCSPRAWPMRSSSSRQPPLRA